jgi:hypothetical protein
MRPVSGKNTGGVMPPTLARKTKQNSVVRYGANAAHGRLEGDLVADEVDDRLHHVLEPGGDQLGLAEGEEEQPPDDQHDQEHLEHHAVDAEVDAEHVDVHDGRPLELLDAGGVEALPGQGKRRCIHGRSLSWRRSA